RGAEEGRDLERWFAVEPAARRSNALRAWLARSSGSTPPATLIERLLRELPGTAPARWPCADGELRRFRGRLRFSAGSDGAGRSEPEASVAPRCGVHRLPGWGGRLRIRSVTSGGVSRSCLAELRLVRRSGGEQFQSAPSRPARSLKKCFQASAVPAWARAGPLVYAGERLLYVPGLGVDARSLAPPGHAQVAFEWLTDAT
ncbi:MAG TPA: tRNA lysidine(34) synthetase TilS, partial [Burkholderiaceae bacterium]|nr:tRNA lysidine(34) synthetase TilS [Burkholderiaceae bacterium]